MNFGLRTLVPARAPRMQEDLDGAAGAPYRRIETPAHSPSSPLDAGGGAAERGRHRALVARGVVEPELEHRLHQRHELGIGRELHVLELTNGCGHGQVRQVHRDQVDGVRHQLPVEGPQVDPPRD